MKTETDVKSMLMYAQNRLEHIKRNSQSDGIDKVRANYEGFADALEWVLEIKDDTKD